MSASSGRSSPSCPRSDAGVRLFDAVIELAVVPSFTELKRAQVPTGAPGGLIPSRQTAPDGLQRLAEPPVVVGRRPVDRGRRRGGRLARRLVRRPLHAEHRRHRPGPTATSSSAGACSPRWPPSCPGCGSGRWSCSTTYRHPAVLANLAATVDHVSGGRLVLGLGAGWQINEHDAYGIELGSVKERLDRFEEACQVVTEPAPRGPHDGRGFALPGGRRALRAEAGAAPAAVPDRRRRREAHAAPSRPATPTSGTSGARPSCSRTRTRCSTATARRSAATRRPSAAPARRWSASTTPRPSPNRAPARWSSAHPSRSPRPWPSTRPPASTSSSSRASPTSGRARATVDRFMAEVVPLVG